MNARCENYNNVISLNITNFQLILVTIFLTMHMISTGKCDACLQNATTGVGQMNMVCFIALG